MILLIFLMYKLQLDVLGRSRFKKLFMIMAFVELKFMKPDVGVFIDYK